MRRIGEGRVLWGIFTILKWGFTARPRRLEREWAYLEKYVGVDKVYLETYRGGTTVEKEHMRLFLDFFRSHGVETAGGFTTVVPDLSEEDEKRQRLFHTYCYSNPGMREHLKKMTSEEII